MSEHKLLMIPGPCEFDSAVLSAMSTPATSHVSPTFIQTFGESIRLLRKVFLTETAQPFILAGSGTLTWDMTAANLVEVGERVLVVNSGIFGDWFAECLEVYGSVVDQIRTDFGSYPTLDAIESALKTHRYKLITITHVDTSTGVLANIEEIAKLVHRVSPDTLIALDGVCSVGGEVIRMDDWGLDVVMTASQKAIGVPPGLALMVFSQRAMTVALERKTPPTIYFGSLVKWLPIMKKYEAGLPSYFATPPVQLIMALEVSLKQVLRNGMDHRFAIHQEASLKFKEACAKLGLKLVPKTKEVAANTLTAIYYPEGVKGMDLVRMMSEEGIVVAGGLHPDHASTYFRIGHMNVSVDEGCKHVDKVIEVMTKCLKTLAKV